MGKHTTSCARAILCAAALLTTSIMATPPCDDVTKAEGCIDIQGGKGAFTVSASFDVGTGGKSGSLKYVDTASNFQVTSSTLQDYSYLDTNVRGFVFAASGSANGTNYNEARVFVSDFGSSGDEFEIQLLQNGAIVYDEHGTLSADCTGAGINGVVIASNCNPCECPGTPPPPPPPTDKCKHHLHGKHCNGMDKCKHHDSGKHCSRDGDEDECVCKPPGGKPPGDNNGGGKKDRRKGNNGVGNGLDPQPPGNPPINDGPGTSPGNPGNRGGAHKK